jgi:hypothetical protein
MSKRRLYTWIGLITLAAFLVIGFVEVMERRFAEGNVYPHYASFRSDPLGTSAFYETLERMDAFRVRRNIKHLNTVKGIDGDTVLLLLGYPREDFPNLRAPEDSAVMRAVKEDGARLVITVNPGLVPEKFLPSTTDEEEDWMERRRKLREKKLKQERGDGEEESDEEEETDEESEEESEEEFEKRMDEALGNRLMKELGFEVESLEEFERPEGGWELQGGQVPGGKKMKGALPIWYSQFRLEELASDWEIVALSDDKPVVAERRYGKGSVVIATDTFFVSNEALHLEPVPEFLLWMLGGKAKVVFDETIHGSQESGGAMKLIRRYRLHGVFIGLLVFVVFWAWRSASPLAPGSEELDRGLIGSGDAVAGEETGSGLIRLLRGSVPPGELLERCLSIWRESSRREISPEAEKEIESIAARHRGDPKQFGLVQAYREISEVLRRR